MRLRFGRSRTGCDAGDIRLRVIGGPVSIGFDFRGKIHVASGHDVSGTGAIGIGRVVRDLGRRGTGVGLLRLCGR